MTILSIISALSENNVIGTNGKLPWHIPEDFQLFKFYTKEKPIIMGRKTWDSLPKKPLPNRINIVVSSNPELVEGECIVCKSLYDAITTAKNSQQANKHGEIFIIGGAQLYQQAIDNGYIDRLYLSHVKKTIQGDTYFPNFDKNIYDVIEEKEYDDFTFKIYQSKN